MADRDKSEPIQIMIDMLPDLSSRLVRIRNFDQRVQRLPDETYAPQGGSLADIEWYSLSAVVKTSSDINAFCAMIESRNSIAAGSVLRSQIDTAMRIFGLSLVEDVEAAGALLMNGGKYSELRHRLNPKQQLRDGYLSEQISARFPWVRGAYADACENVHLTHRTIKHKLKFLGGRIFFNLSGLDHESVEETAYYHLADTFFIALEMTIDLLHEFLSTRPGLEERMKLMLASRV